MYSIMQTYIHLDMYINQHIRHFKTSTNQENYASQTNIFNKCYKEAVFRQRKQLDFGI